MLIRFPGKKSVLKSDEDLIKEFSSSGDLEVLGELYSKYMHLVYGVCLKYLKEREGSMDAVMQIFENLITDIPQQKILNFRSWLYVVTKNFCLMELRSKKSQAEMTRDLITEGVSFMENSIEMHPIDKDEINMDEALEDCIEKLNEEQRICIRKFYFENKCYNDIAKDLGMDEKNVKSYLQNGKRNLKLCLEKKDERKT
jgi:RNA polymerase sigma-70 factor (ECF subfamily)